MEMSPSKRQEKSQEKEAAFTKQNWKIPKVTPWQAQVFCSQGKVIVSP